MCNQPAQHAGETGSFEETSGADDADPSRALELIDLLLGALIAAANPSSMNYRGDGAAYRRNHRRFKRIVVALGIKQPFPWPNLEEGVAAAKSQFRERGSYALRAAFFRERTDADQVLADPSAIRAELVRIEAMLPGLDLRHGRARRPRGDRMVRFHARHAARYVDLMGFPKRHTLGSSWALSP